MRRFINVIGLSLLLGFLGLFALAQDPSQQTECPPPGQLVPEETEETKNLSERDRQALLSWVDRTVQNNYVDPNYGGLDWERVVSEYEPRVMEAETDQEVYSLLNELVRRLQDERSEFLSPEGVRAAEAFRRNVPENFYGIGINVNFSHDNRSLHVLQVYPGGSASEAGIRRRDRILMVDGEPCPAPVKIRGPEGSEVTLTVQSPGEEPRELTLERRPVNFTEMPLSYRFEATPHIAFIWVPAFPDDMPQRFHSLLGDMLAESPLEGLVLDLRGSGAGRMDAIADVAGQFGITDFGRYRSRHDTRLVTLPRQRTSPHSDTLKELPLVVLVDEHSHPGIEMLAARLQQESRATIVGSQTSGDTLVTNGHSFRGAELRLAESEFVLPDDTSFAGVGVMPDVELEADWTSFTEEDDPVIQRAVEILGAGQGAAD